MSICVSRPAGGITLNAGIREYLCDENNKVIQFEDEVSASSFLVELGLNADDFVDLIFHQVCENCGEPIDSHGECIKTESLQ